MRQRLQRQHENQKWKKPLVKEAAEALMVEDELEVVELALEAAEAAKATQILEKKYKMVDQ